ncbi:lysosomal proton-coupled steroid conjugate and bile acid symporter SLC46A3-like [Ylistrum balloti]|uniref:lysosomal proton-coupled steroid conjugate and bile acid symporter SLC46A3-like n=1 Tax=Ylistrum balloti TaxID=509963 RepID=UPI00290593ED|nr:lysosomal proton-coupled steroid conjugate and bile acid symporter SLC46A3-like [Ylistrum balloti]
MAQRQNYSLQTLENKESLPTFTSKGTCVSIRNSFSEEQHSDTVVSASVDVKSSDHSDDLTVAEIKSRQPLVRFLILVFIMLLLIYSFVLTQLITSQYIYAYIRKTMFPNVSFSTNESECQINKTSQVYSDQQIVQKHAAQLNIYLELAKGIPGILSIWFYGSLSDKYGRKPFLLIPFAGNMIKCILITLGMFFNWNIYTFMFFNFFDGIGGTWVLAMSVVMSIVADVTEPGKTRSFIIAMTEISLGFGLIIGGFTSGFLIKAVGFTYSMLVCSCCSLIPVILLIFVPETFKKSKDNQRKTITQFAVDIYVFYVRDSSIKGKRKIFVVCLLIYFCILQAAFGGNGIETLYGLNSPFCWSSVQVGTYITLRGGLPFATGLLLFRPLQLCLDEGFIAILAVLSNFAGFVLEAFSYNTVMLFLVPALSFARTMAVPVLRGIMSRLTPHNKQGSMFAGMAIVETFCSLYGSVVSNAIYGETVEIFRGAAFLFLAGFLFIALVLSFVLYVLNRKSKADEA